MSRTARRSQADGRVGLWTEGRGRVRRVRPWLRLLHFGPSLFTTLAFGVYVFLAAQGRPAAGGLALLRARILAPASAEAGLAHETLPTRRAPGALS